MGVLMVVVSLRGYKIKNVPRFVFFRTTTLDHVYAFFKFILRTIYSELLCDCDLRKTCYQLGRCCELLVISWEELVAPLKRRFVRGRIVVFSWGKNGLL